MVTNEWGEVIDPRESLEIYNLHNLRNNPIWTPENIKSEYQRLRKIANRRLERMGKYEEGWNSRTYRENIGKYKPYRELTPGEAKVLLADVARMLAAKRGTLTGIRAANKQAIETLQERGYEFINAGNIHDFGRFMETWRSSSHRGYGSIYATDLWSAAIRKEIAPAKVRELFLEFQMAKGPVNPTKGEPSADDLIDAFSAYMEL